MLARVEKMLIPMQGMAAIVALVTLALWPPSSGELLLIPLATHDASAVAKVALAGGAVMLGSGPLPGSLIVLGDRSRIARNIASWNIVIMAAPPGGCRPTGAQEAAA